MPFILKAKLRVLPMGKLAQGKLLQ